MRVMRLITPNDISVALELNQQAPLEAIFLPSSQLAPHWAIWRQRVSRREASRRRHKRQVH
jgi:hypothetical protein